MARSGFLSHPRPQTFQESLAEFQVRHSRGRGLLVTSAGTHPSLQSNASFTQARRRSSCHSVAIVTFTDADKHSDLIGRLSQAPRTTLGQLELRVLGRSPQPGFSHHSGALRVSPARDSLPSGTHYPVVRGDSQARRGSAPDPIIFHSQSSPKFQMNTARRSTQMEKSNTGAEPAEDKLLSLVEALQAAHLPAENKGALTPGRPTEEKNLPTPFPPSLLRERSRCHD